MEKTKMKLHKFNLKDYDLPDFPGPVEYMYCDPDSSHQYKTSHHIDGKEVEKEYTYWFPPEETVENIRFIILKNSIGCFYVVKGDSTFIKESIIDKIKNQTYTSEDVIDWMTNDECNDFRVNDESPVIPGFFETRALILRMLKGDVIEKALNLTPVTDVVHGEDLYKNNPIGMYYQQGDAIYSLEEEGDNPRIISFDEMVESEPFYDSINGNTLEGGKEFLIRLRSNIWYQLLEGDFRVEDSVIKAKFLKMGNASFYNERAQVHIEMVDPLCNTIMDAISFRNKGIKSLPYRLS